MNFSDHVRQLLLRQHRGNDAQELTFSYIASLSMKGVHCKLKFDMLLKVHFALEYCDSVDCCFKCVASATVR